jgi:hypothetical protein
MQDEWVIAKVFQKPGEGPPGRKNHRLAEGLSSAGAGDASCFSDSTSVGGGSAPHQMLTDASLFAAADGESSYGGGVAVVNTNAAANNGSNNLMVTGRELVPCFSTSAAPPMDAILGIGQYDPAPLAFEPPPANFFANLRSLHDHLPPLFPSGPSSALGGSADEHHYWGAAGGMEVKLEAAMAPAQLLDGAYAWGF